MVNADITNYIIWGTTYFPIWEPVLAYCPLVVVHLLCNDHLYREQRKHPIVLASNSKCYHFQRKLRMRVSLCYLGLTAEESMSKTCGECSNARYRDKAQKPVMCACTAKLPAWVENTGIEKLYAVHGFRIPEDSPMAENCDCFSPRVCETCGGLKGWFQGSSYSREYIPCPDCKKEKV